MWCERLNWYKQWLLTSFSTDIIFYNNNNDDDDVWATALPCFCNNSDKTDIKHKYKLNWVCGKYCVKTFLIQMADDERNWLYVITQ